MSATPDTHQQSTCTKEKLHSVMEAASALTARDEESANVEGTLQPKDHPEGGDA
jgi:hypothetical protein